MSADRLLAVVLDAESAGWLLLGLRLVRAHQEERGRVCPQAVADLEHAAETVRNGLEATGADTFRAAGYGRTHEQREQQRRALSYREAGEAVGVSAKTIERMVDRGELLAVPFGRARRIAVAELDRYLTAAATQLEEER